MNNPNSNLANISSKRIGLVCAQFNDIVTGRLLMGAKNYLVKIGIPEANIIIKHVPGAFELPLACQKMLTSSSSSIDACIAIGAVIRGSTNHYDYVCSGTTSGLMTVQLQTSKPIGFCLLTCDTLEQAFDRAGGKLGNKGAECAATVIEVIS